MEELNTKQQEDIDSLNIDIKYLETLNSFMVSEAGKQIIEYRQNQVVRHIAKLTGLIDNPNMEKMLSSIIQLKVAIRDLTDFCGIKGEIEEKQLLIEAIIKSK